MVVRDRGRRNLPTIVFVCASLLCASAQAEVDGAATAQGSTEPVAPVPLMLSTSIGYTNFPYAKFEPKGEDTLGEVQITQWDWNISKTQVFNGGKTILIGGLDYQRLDYEYRDFDDSPLDSVQSITLGLTLIQQLTQSWGLLLVLSPGYADDFRGDATTDAVTLNFIGAVNYRFNEGLQMGLGFAGLSILGKFRPLPVASLSWQITERLSVDSLLPAHAYVNWQPIDALGLRAGFKLDGNSFHGDKDEYELGNPQIQYSAMTAELAAQWFVVPWLHITAHGGYTLNRRFEVSDGRSSIEDGKYDLDNDAVFGVRIGIDR